ncbi:DnaA/Hda family protein [Tautonia plasticadhaerens]|uniref:Chromosomal replication initiator protein DnaA n=1 Tax=Tautonia plasticadhaerens TaxID=2527974 RepID=A0A518H9E5_9BACT|nr:DnaA/Hda family protein [Tautonia plasticadhaerens]QDV37478.1 Chromosomal replication initiator protein DnaA [Tautonia plasticadhaerens]
MEPSSRPPDPGRNPPGPWDGFLVGPENSLAHAAARELARGATGESPLVLIGPSGSGKSRILEAMAADRVSRNSGAAIALIPGEVFVSDCHEAGDLNSSEAWSELRLRYRNLDLLAIDDLNPLSRSPLALAELEPTLDELDAAGASVAVTVRDDPGRWESWPRRLADRLRAGLTARIDGPGPPSRRRFLLDRTRARGVAMTAEAIDLLAEAADGYRTLEGWIARLELNARVDRRPIDRVMAAALLADDEATAPAASIAEISRAVASRFGLRVRDLRSSSRRAALVVPRHLAILLSRELTRSSFASLGAAFGDRDPKSIRHACRAASIRIANDPAIASVAEAIRRKWADAPA